MKSMKPLLIGLVSFATVVAILAPSGFGRTSTAKETGNGSRSTGGIVDQGQPLTTGHITITITERGLRLEHVVPANFAVEPGVPLRLTFINHMRRAHTFTVPGLGISVFIPAGTKRAPSKTVFRFTPSKFGIFRWYCALPCGKDMSGEIYAIIGK